VNQPNTGPLILLVNDDIALLYSFQQSLSDEGFQVMGVRTGSDALHLLEERDVQLMLIDIRLPDMDGATVLHQAREEHRLLEVIILTDHVTLDSAVAAVRAGAFDYLPKRVSHDVLIRTVRRALERRQNRAMVDRRTRELVGLNAISDVVSQAMELKEVIRWGVRMALEVMDVEYGLVCLLSSDGEPQPAGCFDGREDVFSVPQCVGNHDFCLAHRVAKHRRSRFAASSERPIDLPCSCAENVTVASAASVPLVSSGQVLGSLTLYSDQPRQFVHSQRRLIEGIGQQLGSAVERAMLYDSLRASESRFRAIIEGVHDLICIVSESGEIEFVNSRLSSMMGYAQDEVLGKLFADVFLPADASEDSLATLEGLCSHGIALAELTLVDREGQLHISSVSSSRLRSDLIEGLRVSSSEWAGSTVLVIRDVTDRQRRERELIELYDRQQSAAGELSAKQTALAEMQKELTEAQRRAIIGEISVSLRQEVNDPLTSILGNVQWLLRQDEPMSTTEAQETLQSVGEQALKIRDIIKQLQQIEEEHVRDDLDARYPPDSNRAHEESLRNDPDTTGESGQKWPEDLAAEPPDTLTD